MVDEGVWDLRTNRLLRTLPCLDGAVMKPSAAGDVLYTYRCERGSRHERGGCRDGTVFLRVVRLGVCPVRVLFQSAHQLVCRFFLIVFNVFVLFSHHHRDLDLSCSLLFPFFFIGFGPLVSESSSLVKFLIDWIFSFIFGAVHSSAPLAAASMLLLQQLCGL